MRRMRVFAQFTMVALTESPAIWSSTEMIVWASRDDLMREP
jgi:hypothetical protein